LQLEFMEDAEIALQAVADGGSPEYLAAVRGIAQLAEHALHNRGIVGSPLGSPPLSGPFLSGLAKPAWVRIPPSAPLRKEQKAA
jgi:hypothetical protein